MPNYQPNETRRDGIKWVAHAHVDKYDEPVVQELTEYLGYEPDGNDFARLSIKPNDQAEAHGNALTTAGLTRITALITNTGSTQAFTNGAGRIGVGDSSTAYSAGQTDLQASSNKYFMTLTATYPTVSAGLITAQATYASGVGNFAWEEWCWDITNSGTAAAGTTVSNVMINRKVASLGTKASGASWVFTTTVTLS